MRTTGALKGNTTGMQKEVEDYLSQSHSSRILVGWPVCAFICFDADWPHVCHELLSDHFLSLADQLMTNLVAFNEHPISATSPTTSSKPRYCFFMPLSDVFEVISY